MAATQPGKESQQASKQKAWQHLRSGLAIGAMTALCGGFLWMLYAPQEKTPGNEMFEGFDTSIPDATVSEMNADKRKVYEEIHRQELWQDKVRSLEDFSEDTLLSDSMTRIETSPTPGAGASAIDASHDTYRTLNRQIASFYRPTPAEDPRVADLQRQVEELTRRLESRTSPSVEHPTADEVLERSYALAARYFPNGAADGREPVAASVPATVSPAEQITVVRPVTSVVSTLALPDTLPDIPRNRAFRTAVGPDTTTPTGMIHACIAGEQRIAAGERVRLRNFISEFSHDRIVLISTHIVSDIEYISTRNAIMKAGEIVDVGTTAELVKRIEGKVWNCIIPTSKLPECEMRLRIINQRGEDHNQVSIRYLSEHSEIDGSVTTEPRLEDLYLWLFPQTDLEKEDR